MDSPPFGFDYLLVVSGLPRSGTSLMMQMLRAGGIRILHDATRPPDQFNPKGYYESSRFRGLRVREIIPDLYYGYAVKVVSPSLFYLPTGYEYRVIYMMRDIIATLRSQDRIHGVEIDEGYETSLAHRSVVWQELREKAWSYVEKTPGFDGMRIWYEEVIEDPRLWAECIATFLNLHLDPKKMARAVSPGLKHF